MSPCCHWRRYGYLKTKRTNSLDLEQCTLKSRILYSLVMWTQISIWNWENTTGFIEAETNVCRYTWWVIGNIMGFLKTAKCCACADSSKDMGGRDAKKSQGMACSPQKCQRIVGWVARGRLVRKHLSVILGIRKLLEEFRCLAKTRDKASSGMGEEEFLKTDTHLNLWTISLRGLHTRQAYWILFKISGHIQFLRDQTMGMMELLQPQTWVCGRHSRKSEEKRTDYLFICYFHFL